MLLGCSKRQSTLLCEHHTVFTGAPAMLTKQTWCAATDCSGNTVSKDRLQVGALTAVSMLTPFCELLIPYFFEDGSKRCSNVGIWGI